MSMNRRLAILQKEHAEIVQELENAMVLNDLHGNDDDKYDKQFLALTKKSLELEAAIVEEKRLQAEELNAGVTQVALDTTDGTGQGEHHPALVKRERPANLSTNGFASIGEFAAAIFRMKAGNREMDARLRSLDTNGPEYLAANIGLSPASMGGFAVPTQFIFDAFFVDTEDTVILQLCDKIQMTSDKLVVPTFPDTTHATSPHGISWGMVGEAGAIPNDDVEFGQINLEAKKAGCLFYLTNEFFRDARAQTLKQLDNIILKSLRWFIESKLVNGNGAGEPQGILNAAGKVSVAKQSTQNVGSATIVTENIVKMWSRMLDYAGAIWMCNADCFPQLATLTLNVGTGGSNVSILSPETRSVAAGPSHNIFGKPLYYSEHCAAVGTVGDIVLVNPNYYLLGDRMQATIDTSGHVAFTTDRTCWRALARFDAQPKMSSVFTPKNGTTKAPIVTLATR